MPTKLVKTRHYHVSKQIREQLRLVPPGSKLPTMVELQKQYKASRTTVERALDRLRKDRFIHRPDGKQRFVVSKYNDRAIHRVALIRPDFPSQDYDAICRAVVNAGKAEDWAFDLVHYRRFDSLDLETASSDDDAIVLLPLSEQLPDHILAALNNPRKPAIILQEHYRYTNACNVTMNDFAVGKMAAEHLLNMGHRKIACVLDQPKVSTIIQRMEGWRERMIASGETQLDDLIIDCNVVSGQDALSQTYEKLCKYLDSLNGPPSFTGIFNTSDLGAMATLRVLEERSIKVPEQISVVAFSGESNLAPFLRVPLTAAEADINQYGIEVIRLLDRLLTNKKIYKRFIYIEPTLVARKSTASLMN